MKREGPRQPDRRGLENQASGRVDMTALNRRQFVAGAAAASVALGQAGSAQAQAANKFTIISHRVHQQTLTEGPAGNVLKGWTDQNNATLDWVTLDLNAIHDRVF